MSDVNSLFRKRIGFPEKEEVSFSNLEVILEKMSRSIPFENFSVIKNRREKLTKENLIEKVLVRNEGGLCYELNPILYQFLHENGFDVTMVRGVVFNQETQSWSKTERTHVAILLFEQGETYLVDSGFGGNHPLKPVPLSGETVYSNNGAFRIKKSPNEFGDYLFEKKVKDKDADWKIGYTFDSLRPFTDFSELTEVQTAIFEHEHSAFNKSLLITRLTDNGSITLTQSSRTLWKKGMMEKEPIDSGKFTDYLKRDFGIQY